MTQPSVTPTRPGAITRRASLRCAGAAAMALLSGCSATAALDRLVAHDTYRGQTGVPYGPDPRHLLDIYQPTTSLASGSAPVVLFFYGGNWTRGERADYRFVGEALAANGIIALVADYRLSPQVAYRQLLSDCALALLWTLSHAEALGGDPHGVLVMGHSAGAYNAAMLALDPRWLSHVGLAPSRLAGWIGLAGPYDFLPIGDPEVQVAFGWPQTPADSQPIYHAATKAPRTLLLAGRDDKTVNTQRNTEGLARKLRAAGNQVDVRIFDGIGHVTTVAALARPLDWLAPVLPTVVAFARERSLPKPD
ncbi:acetyl esterase/lipase [Rhodoferax ferrireducens]|uniref:Acetyl esterase/lipase n=1 Tax=Rhodoferax ferrireducens TaxID=192843 RepID=A0ABU2CFI7_9BURK|nr:alpha/beta hydrolase [Rhodoferax ferrireducens]MDR7380099.1 acetyl esterase/lipase [Rhodoferax ferrireducens]